MALPLGALPARQLAVRGAWDGHSTGSRVFSSPGRARAVALLKGVGAGRDPADPSPTRTGTAAATSPGGCGSTRSSATRRCGTSRTATPGTITLPERRTRRRPGGRLPRPRHAPTRSAHGARPRDGRAQAGAPPRGTAADAFAAGRVQDPAVTEPEGDVVAVADEVARAEVGPGSTQARPPPPAGRRREGRAGRAGGRPCARARSSRSRARSSRPTRTDSRGRRGPPRPGRRRASTSQSPSAAPPSASARTQPG